MSKYTKMVQNCIIRFAKSSRRSYNRVTFIKNRTKFFRSFYKIVSPIPRNSRLIPHIFDSEIFDSAKFTRKGPSSWKTSLATAAFLAIRFQTKASLTRFTNQFRWSFSVFKAGARSLAHERREEKTVVPEGVTILTGAVSIVSILVASYRRTTLPKRKFPWNVGGGCVSDDATWRGIAKFSAAPEERSDLKWKSRPRSRNPWLRGKINDGPGVNYGTGGQRRRQFRESTDQTLFRTLIDI